ncbi:MAG: hypothetical protein P4L64_01430 [Caulobacteraceae bacterium]|nr:hypothetical protein [Caulobacteraceae bacterium]
MPLSVFRMRPARALPLAPGIFRALAVGALAAACVACAPQSSGAGELSLPSAERPSVTPSTTDFVNSIGAGVHMGAVKTGYGDVDAVVSDLRYLGVRHVRDGLGGIVSGTLTNGRWDPDPTSKLERFYAAGIRFDGIAGADFGKFADQMRRYSKYIEAIEGPNEPEMNGTKYGALTGPPAAAAVQKDLYAFVKGDPVLRDKPVLQFAFAYPRNSGTTGDLSPYVDYANIHSYAGHGLAPHLRTPDDLAATVSAPGKPSIVTETGYPTNDPSGPPGARLGPGHSMVDEDVQAKYLLAAVLDDFKQNVTATYLYELLDDRPEPQNLDEQQHFGLFRADGSKKPVAVALHNLNTILTSDGGSSLMSERAAPNWSASVAPGDPPVDVRSYNLLMRKPNGGFDLVLWSEPPLWTAQLQKAPAVSPSRVSIQFGRTFRRVRVFDPLVGVAPIETRAGVSDVVISVTDHPVVIELSDQ